MAETLERGSGRNDIALYDAGRVEPGGPERAGRNEQQWTGSVAGAKRWKRR